GSSSNFAGQDGQDNVYPYNTSTRLNTLVSPAPGAATPPDAGGGPPPPINTDLDTPPNQVGAQDGTLVSVTNQAPSNLTGSLTGLGNTFISGDVVQYDSTQQTLTVMGHAFQPTAMLLVRASLAPTVMSGDGSTVVWDGLAANVDPNHLDLNGNLD